MSMRFTPTTTLTALVLAGVVASGCTAIEKSEKTVKENKNTAEKLNEVAADPAPKADPSRLKVRDGTYVGGTVYKSREGQPLPSKFQTDQGIVLQSAQPLTLEQIGDQITRETGIPVRIDKTAPSAEGGGQNQGPNAQPERTRVRYAGSLSGLLDSVTGRFDLSWEYRRGEIRIYKYATRTFQLATIPGSMNVENSIGNASQSGGGGGGSGNANAQGVSGAEFSTEYSAETAPFSSSLQSSLAAMVGPNGQVQIDPAAQTATVIARPSAMNEIQRFIDEYNKNRSRQVAVSVRVYSVDLSRSDSYGFSLNSMLDFEEFGLDVTSGVTGISQAQAASQILLEGSDIFGSDSSGDLIFKALSKKGRTSIVTSTNQTAVNNKTIPIQATRRQDYVSQIEQTATGEDGNPQISVQTGTLRTGFSMNITPHIRSEKRVMLQIAASLSESNGFDTVEAEGTTVQLPDVESRDFMQQVQIPADTTLVMAGFKQKNANADRSGTGSPSLPILGGSQEGSYGREVVVIAISANVIDFDRKNARINTASSN